MTQTLVNRIVRAEEAAKARSRCSPQCICFPEREQPSFNWPIEQQIAARVKCPLHGERFRSVGFFVYVSKWLREKQPCLLQTHHSEQYRKAWYAGFPQELWPAEEISNDGRIALRLTDGTALPLDDDLSALAQEKGVKLYAENFSQTDPSRRKRSCWTA